MTLVAEAVRSEPIASSTGSSMTELQVDTVPIVEEKPLKGPKNVNMKPIPKPQPLVAEHVDIVSIAETKPLIPLDHHTKVTQDRGLVDYTERDVANSTNRADQEARREGSFASSILHVVGIDEISAPRAPLMGLATRIVQALFSVRAGATASAAPEAPDWDIQYTGLENTAGAIKQYPSHLPVYIPNDMPLEPALALASLFVSGGAGAYDWRFGADDPRVACMPACTRYRHPGGSNRVLLIFERPLHGVVFGGAALTEPALTALEDYYRQKWAGWYWTQAYKTVAAIALVVAAPRPVDPESVPDLPGQPQTSSTGENTPTSGTEVADPLVDNGPYVSAPYIDPEVALRWLSPFAPDALVQIGGASAVPPGVRVEWDCNAKIARYSWIHEEKPHVFDIDIDRVVDAIAEQEGLPPHIVLTVNGIRQQFAGFVLRDEFPARATELPAPRNELLIINSPRDSRTVFSMPCFDLRKSVCLIANVHLPAADDHRQSVIPQKPVV
ncbi:hypothetical protein N7452_007660 [Penicillium brevicompactum]|uniref:Uncharacterized protein n=1 Tax=Penicillium brevicompactum TaxID=5074 RepID=A0A9W9QFX7_PENBR|nr:hypothetical protein N7452_007660 [Penicillium brevicompactum]